MEVLIISLFTEDAWVAHQATELELAQKHIDLGDQVTFLVCDESIGCCTVNLNKDPSICSKCVKMHQRGYDLLSGSFQIRSISEFVPDLPHDFELSINKSVYDRQSAEQLIYKGHSLGLGPVSTLIWNFRDPDFDKLEGSSILGTLTVSTIKTYDAVQKFLEEYSQFDRVYIFNGRFDITKGALAACTALSGCDVFTHERGANPSKYALFKNTIPHDRKYVYEQALTVWNHCDSQEKRDRVANLFYQLRVQGKDKAWKNFLGKQRSSTMPRCFDRRAKNVVIFNSSEDEFAGLGPDWKNPIYKSQGHGIEQIVKDCLDEMPDISLYLRIHPNLEEVVNDDMRRINRLWEENLPNFTVISADSEVDSYALLDAADIIITFGSTIGIEATFHEKPSILVGRAFYEDFGATYNVKSHRNLMNLLSLDLRPKPLLGSMIYGYYYMTRGEDFKHWVAEGFFDGFFEGERLTDTVYSEDAVKNTYIDKEMEPFFRLCFKKGKSLLKAMFRS